MPQDQLKQFSIEEILEEVHARGYGVTNLLEQQIYTAFQECLKNVNQIRFLELLEDISKNGIPNLQKD